MDFEIVKMENRHIRTLVELEKECFSTPWDTASFFLQLGNDCARFFVAVSGDEVLGYIGAFNAVGEVSLGNLAVSEKHRKNGVGSALLEHLTEYVSRENAEFITLEVRASNEAAISLYKKHGFCRCGLRKDFYRKPVEDAILMKKTL